MHATKAVQCLYVNIDRFTLLKGFTTKEVKITASKSGLPSGSVTTISPSRMVPLEISKSSNSGNFVVILLLWRVKRLILLSFLERTHLIPSNFRYLHKYVQKCYVHNDAKNPSATGALIQKGARQFFIRLTKQFN